MTRSCRRSSLVIRAAKPKDTYFAIFAQLLNSADDSIPIHLGGGTLPASGDELRVTVPVPTDLRGAYRLIAYSVPEDYLDDLTTISDQETFLAILNHRTD